VTTESSITIVRGHRMHLHPASADRWVSGFLQQHLAYEPYETEWMENLVRPGDWVVDVGAHIGLYTLQLARWVGPRGRVLAFEPDPDNFALLHRNVAENGYQNVELYQLALGESPGSAELYRSQDNAGDHRVWSHGPPRPSVPVTMDVFDRLMADRSFQCDLIKMDIQGAEYSALLGMEELLERQRRLVLMMEYWPGGLLGCRGDAPALLGLLGRHRFRLYFINEQKRQLVRVEPQQLLGGIDPQTEVFINLICVKSS